MKPEIYNKLNLFVGNTRAMSGFTWQSAYVKHIAAFLYTQENRQVDIAAIQNCYSFIKNQVGMFSPLRGQMSLGIATLLSLKSNQFMLFEEMRKVYAMMRNARFYGSNSLVIAAYQIALHTAPENYTKIIANTRAFYDGMKSRHRFLTQQDDYIFSALLGLSNLNIAETLDYIEQIFQYLKGSLNGNICQRLAQIFVLSGEPNLTAEQMFALMEALKAQKISFNRNYTLPILAVIAMDIVDINIVVRNIMESQALLRKQKGIGSSWMNMQDVLAIIASDNASETKNNLLNVTLFTIVSSILAQEAANTI